MSPILEIRGVSKKFNINRKAEPYQSLRDKLSTIFQSTKLQNEDFWALNDVTFNVGEGESIGIIGKNGAGKSTLLKVLSRITPPTRGRIVSRGRIASLLEVGTGFHPELTGRENVFFNGSILGMRKREIQARFDEIIDFAGTEKFIDTPLKHYSSGMQLRLAFSVAAFLEPEILVIDEVLAVGDAEFQKKCLGKMEDVSKSGRTILFVSHNMAAIESLCSKCVLLHQGSVRAIGPSTEIVNKYTDLVFSNTEHRSGAIEFGDPRRAIRRVMVQVNGAQSDIAHIGCTLEVLVQFEFPNPVEHPVLGIIYRDSQGTAIVGVNNNHYVGNVAASPLRSGTISMKINDLPFIQGSYSIDIHLGDNITDVDVRRDCLTFVVEKMPFTPAGTIPEEKINRFVIRNVTWTAR